MNGAEAVLRTLAASGVHACFANPGTSEMALVAAMDEVPDVRGVLTLFEGVASGAADGWGRMTGGPAATLLHLGPGLGNAFANLHNAYKARTPLVNVVGDHAVLHRPLGAPLTSDVEGVARPVSHWVRTTRDARTAPADAALAVAAARSGQIATLIVPADAGWSPSPGASPPVAPAPAPRAPEQAVHDAVVALRSGEPCALLLGTPATHGRALELAGRIAAATGARLIRDTFVARLERGGDRPRPEPLPYLTEAAVQALAGLAHLVLVGTQRPVGFFAYPGQPSLLADAGTEIHGLCVPDEDAVAALEALAEALNAPPAPAPEPVAAPEVPDGPIDAMSFAAAVGATLPDGAIVVDEAVTAAFMLPEATLGAPEHDWMFITGGAIGQGLPVATGAAIAAPDRPVICLEGDGSAMYTIQSLWTQAREGLDVTTVILANRSYAILALELARVGAEGGEAARDLLEIGRPALDFVKLGESMGVPGRRVDDARGLAAALREAIAEPGPHLIEAVL
ncbi:acetolactate synthase large subunit [Candidatus Solirubrobacter pratensis]|uniref:acetolactate synthase large subunit n=1 Tax=Candidatus Solirubrobacter pratensis TaxID=1298857 RepID=UPI0003FA7D2C|nr:acetolactate synthase large subunit [Candidatus Solirubrobacter pratensis]